MLIFITAVISLIIGAIGGMLYTQKRFKKELKENPPISEKMIRDLMSQMGQKPNEKRVRQIYKSMNNQ